MMHWHFSDDTGSEFWLDQKKSLGFNPVKDIKTLEDIRHFGLFDKEKMRAIDVDLLIPKGFINKPRTITETGGTTGMPIKIAKVTTEDYNVIQYDAMIQARGIKPANILAMTPSGPHAYGDFVRRLGASWNKSVYYIDFDPRWVKKTIERTDIYEAYVEHLFAQTFDIMKTQKTKVLFTTSKLLMQMVLVMDKPLCEYGIEAVCTGGTSCTQEEIRYLNENFLQNVHWIDTYGNTLLGHALQADPWSGYAMRSYYVPPPLGIIRIVDPVNWNATVDYYQRGRVLIITLLEDLFIPNLLERDSAVRVPPHPWYPWDGVTDVLPYTGPGAGKAIEGVY